jgi:hypothetical protein
MIPKARSQWLARQDKEGDPAVQGSKGHSSTSEYFPSSCVLEFLPNMQLRPKSHTSQRPKDFALKKLIEHIMNQTQWSLDIINLKSI